MNIPESVKLLVKQYKELGFVTIAFTTVTVSWSPIVAADEPKQYMFLKWLREYCLIHNQIGELDGSYFYTLFDGFRERTNPSLEGGYVPLPKIDGREPADQFVNSTQLGEPYPILPYPVLSWSRHKGDLSVVLIPDQYYIQQNGYFELLLQIKQSDWRPWAFKQNKVFWRGGTNGYPYSIYDPTCTMNQRQIAVAIGSHHLDVMDIQHSGSTPKSEFLKYKYLLDVDGTVNAWDGFFWKLGSNSVVLKMESHWEEWYYDQIKPWVHYIPVKGDGSDLYEKYQWAEANQDKVQDIIRNANELVYKNRYEYTLLSKKIATNFKDSKELIKKYYP